jgi:hypothetical protein
MLEADERHRPSYHAYTKHIPNPFGISILAILGPILVHSSVTTSQNSSDLVSYVISKALLETPATKHREEPTQCEKSALKI